ncbi:hypothetical protein PIB30_044523 [Stylosanthes scabra]|uniref:Uncharacterized protein n=1 Tax=Stylosanthes scabra TaxID=79078 RepID=A0ABU6RFX5_9FABA|nr:hypothetical protein [Stylosanthes scabra]
MRRSGEPVDVTVARGWLPVANSRRYHVPGRAHDPARVHGCVRPPRLLPHHLRMEKPSTSPRWGSIAINPIPVPDGAVKNHATIHMENELHLASIWSNMDKMRHED